MRSTSSLEDIKRTLAFLGKPNQAHPKWVSYFPLFFERRMQPQQKQN